MKLRWAPASPFVRKVMVTAMETGQDNRIERMPTDYHDPDSDIADHNPLGKVPALILDDGSILIDSRLSAPISIPCMTAQRSFPTIRRNAGAYSALRGWATV